MVARSEYEEPALMDSELDEFLEHSISFFNSFTHRVKDEEDVSEGSEPDSNITTSRSSSRGHERREPSEIIT